MESETVIDQRLDFGLKDFPLTTLPSSGNVSDPYWREFLAFRWLIKPSTPAADPDLEEKHEWAQLAEEARKSWEEENPY